jgi:hypothetical protein
LRDKDKDALRIFAACDAAFEFAELSSVKLADGDSVFSRKMKYLPYLRPVRAVSDVELLDFRAGVFVLQQLYRSAATGDVVLRSIRRWIVHVHSAR